jgi:hypothetical protein
MRGQDVPNPSSWPIKKDEPWQEPPSPSDRTIPWQPWEWWVLLGLFMLMLATRLPVRSFGGTARWWIAGMLGLGLGMGAKQLSPVFLAGLWVRTLWEYVRHGRFYVIALGLLGGVLVSFTWFIPLSLHMGTAHAYVAAALSQLAWGRARDAFLFNLCLRSYDPSHGTALCPGCPPRCPLLRLLVAHNSWHRAAVGVGGSSDALYWLHPAHASS